MESRNQRDINALAAEFANDIQKLETENVHLLIGPQNATATTQIVKSLKEVLIFLPSQDLLFFWCPLVAPLFPSGQIFGPAQEHVNFLVSRFFFPPG